MAFLYQPVKSGEPEGDWRLIEARGVMFGVVETTLYSRIPDFWGLMTRYFDYDGVEAAGYSLGDRLLKLGSEGDDVKELQTDLIRLGYDCGKWGADGEYGESTELAVRAFQRDQGLTEDGDFGPETLNALERALAKAETPVPRPRQVEIVSGNCYIRAEPNANVKKLGVAHAGDRLIYGGRTDEATRWLLVDYLDTQGWVSNKYGRLI